MEEVKEKLGSLIEKIWWVIPPAFIVFVYLPVGLILLSILSGGEPSLSFKGYIEALKKIYIPHRYVLSEFSEFWTFLWERLLVLGPCLGLMALGMLFTKRESLKLRITIPIILAILGTLIVTLFFAILMLLGMWTSPRNPYAKFAILGSFIVIWGIAIRLWLLPMRHQVRFLWKFAILGSFIVIWGIAIRLWFPWMPMGDQWELTLLAILGLLIIALVRALLWLGSYCRPLESDENGI